MFIWIQVLTVLHGRKHESLINIYSSSARQQSLVSAHATVTLAQVLFCRHELCLFFIVVRLFVTKDVCVLFFLNSTRWRMDEMCVTQTAHLSHFSGREISSQCEVAQFGRWATSGRPLETCDDISARVTGCIVLPQRKRGQCAEEGVRQPSLHVLTG